MPDQVAVIVAHPDDEVLCCGGTIAKLAAAGDDVSVLILCCAPGVKNAAGREGHSAQAYDASLALGVMHLAFGAFPDQTLDLVGQRELSAYVAAYLAERGPFDAVYTHHPGDLNADHRATAEAVLVATRPIAGRPVPRAVYACEALSSTEWSFGSARPFRPTRYEALTEDHVVTKQGALERYASEVRQPPHPRSWVGVLQKCGARGAECGHKYAEAFELLREVIR